MASVSLREKIASIEEHRRNNELSILRLSEPLITDYTQHPDSSKRASDASAAAYDTPSPASLETDLVHYKELFSKLRFSYLEQVTKEKFLRAIVGDPPLVVEHAENVDLERQLADVKADLKSRKMEVDSLLKQLEQKGRQLSARYKDVQFRTAQLSQLPVEIEELQVKVEGIKAAQGTRSSNPALALPLPQTKSLLAEREAELKRLDVQLATLQSAVPRKTRELDMLEGELGELEKRKMTTVAAAREAQGRKGNDEGGLGNELERRGRWLRASEATMKGLARA